MTDPLNEGMARRAEEKQGNEAPKQQQVPLNAENAAKIIGNYLSEEKETAQVHATMSKCLGYLVQNAKANEDYIEATNRPDEQSN